MAAQGQQKLYCVLGNIFSGVPCQTECFQREVHIVAAGLCVELLVCSVPNRIQITPITPASNKSSCENRISKGRVNH